MDEREILMNIQNGNWSNSKLLKEISYNFLNDLLEFLSFSWDPW